MNKILMKAEVEDFEFIIGILRGKVKLRSDTKLREVIDVYEKEPTRANKVTLASNFERHIRYLGSSDIAYFVRYLYKDSPGVKAQEIIDDVSKKLKVSQRKVGTIEAQLERLVKISVEKTVMEMNNEKIREILKEAKFSPSAISEIMKQVKQKGKVAIIPILFSAVGSKAGMKILETLILSLLGALIGRETVKIIIKELAKKIPIAAPWLGPIMWGITVGWIGVDIAGPAYRKTIPVLLYLGMIGLRDGPEDGEDFWKDPEVEKVIENG